MTGEEIPVTDEGTEWDDELEAPSENIDPVIGGALFCVLGAALFLLSVPGLAVIMDGGSMTAYGQVGAFFLFICGVLLTYAGGVFYTEEKHDVGGDPDP